VPLLSPKRLFRISLRTLFVLTTVLCVWLGFKVHPVEQQQEAVAWVMERGGHVIYDFEFDGDVIAIPYAKPPGPDWLRDILGIDYFARPHWIELHDQRLANLSPLAQLDGLWCLQVSSKSLNDILALGELTNLEHLALACRDTPDLTPLANLTRLKRLHLWMPVKDEDLAWLRDTLPQCAIYQEPAKWK
jgi:hypothetical protein